MIELYADPDLVGPKVWGIHGEAAFLDLRRDSATRRAAAKIATSCGIGRPRTGYRERGHAGHRPGECVSCDVADNLPGATK